MEIEQQPEVTTLDVSSVVTVRLPRRAKRAWDTLCVLTGAGLSWSGPRRELCRVAVELAAGEPFSYKTAGDALADLEHEYELIRRQRNGPIR